jgi:S1-C subfamily serine protease
MRPDPRVRPLVLLLIGATLLAASPIARAEEPAETAFREARAYTVRVRTQITTPFADDERGSFEGAGFLVDARRGWIVTNAHVVGRSPSTVQVAFSGGAYHRARKVYVDLFADIAVIQVEPTGKHSVAVLGCGEELNVGESIGAFGHPLGIPFTGTRGIVSGRTDQFGGEALIQIDATVDHGNSGGPVIAFGTGHVVGIATAMAGKDKTERVNFATPIGEVCRILELLRQGISPAPPQMPLSLLEDEDGRTTLEVGVSNDPKRWPLEPRDWILAVANGDSLRSLSDLVSALRGKSGPFDLMVNRDGRRRTVRITPRPSPSVIARHGVSVDGALIAPVSFDDATSLREPAALMVQSVEPGSSAEMLELEQEDLLWSVEGKRFDDVDRLLHYLETRKPGPIEIVVRRWSGEENHIFEFNVRSLPGEDIHPVGPEVEMRASGGK